MALYGSENSACNAINYILLGRTLEWGTNYMELCCFVELSMRNAVMLLLVVGKHMYLADNSFR